MHFDIGKFDELEIIWKIEFFEYHAYFPREGSKYLPAPVSLGTYQGFGPPQ
jgi:hypothetical protein